MCQSGMFYLRWAHRFYVERNEVPFYANRLCDDYGLDTWSLEAMIGWLHRCHRLGIVSEEAVGLPLSKLGSLEFIEALVKMLSLREGFGDLLARGTARAAEALGVDAAEQIRHVDPYDPRIYLSTALLWAMETREPIQELHEVGMPLAQFSSWAKKVEGAYVSGDVVRAVARRFWGSELAGDFSTCEGKALAAKRIQDRQRVKESLILCDFLFPVLTIEHSEDHVGDPTLESKLYSAVTGNELGEEELLAKGETIFNLQRAVLVRERRAGREADRLPEEWHSTPLKKGSMDPECLVTGPEGRVVSRVGSVVDRQEFERMKDEYYGLRGWDVATGLQTRSGLEQLGMKDVADDLERRGLLA